MVCSLWRKSRNQWLHGDLAEAARQVRLSYEISCRLPGLPWKDLRIGFEHIPQWERVAVVTDVRWARRIVNALRFLTASDVRVFTSFQAPERRT